MRHRIDWRVMIVIGLVYLVHHGINAGQYQLGRITGRWEAQQKIEGIVAAGKVYLAPLEMNASFQTAEDCIFLLVDPNSPALRVNKEAMYITISRCTFDFWSRIPAEHLKSDNSEKGGQ